jgi:uncharacterized protein with gpF-like domain
MKRKEKILRPIHPNAGLRAAYRRRLLAMVDEMIISYRYWLIAAYRKSPSQLAQDKASSVQETEIRARQRAAAHSARKRAGRRLAANNMIDALDNLGKRWERRINRTAPLLAKYFATKVEERSAGALKSALKSGGFTVEFKMTAAVRDVMTASVAENVSLIKSIPQQFHTEVEGLVMRSVAAGRDLSELSDELERRFALTRKRAELIARDQNNKATAAITRVRYVDMGIQQAVWMHSHAGKTPRPTHLAAGRRKEVFNVAEGWYDPDPKVRHFIQPGELINCRCVCRPIIKGFS